MVDTCPITLYYLSLIGAQARESGLKADTPWPPLRLKLTNSNFKAFLHRKPSTFYSSDSTYTL
jgi:hypothetical protein